MRESKRPLLKARERLFRDFPWLWAICSWWVLGDPVKIKNADSADKDDMAFSGLRINRFTQEEVWVHCASIFGHEWVKKIKFDVSNVLIAELVRDFYLTTSVECCWFQPREMIILNVVYVFKDKDHGNSITIYRPPKTFKNFNSYLENLGFK
jgi:hypothetical protein